MEKAHEVNMAAEIIQNQAKQDILNNDLDEGENNILLNKIELIENSGKSEAYKAKQLNKLSNMTNKFFSQNLAMISMNFLH